MTTLRVWILAGGVLILVIGLGMANYHLPAAGVSIVQPTRRSEISKRETATLIRERFTITNHNNEAITLLGAKFSCYCTTIANAPIEFPPGSTKDIELTVDPSGGLPGEYRFTAKLLWDTEVPEQQLQIELTILDDEVQSDEAAVIVDESGK